MPTPDAILQQALGTKNGATLTDVLKLIKEKWEPAKAHGSIKLVVADGKIQHWFIEQRHQGR